MGRVERMEARRRSAAVGPLRGVEVLTGGDQPRTLVEMLDELDQAHFDEQLAGLEKLLATSAEMPRLLDEENQARARRWLLSKQLRERLQQLDGAHPLTGEGRSTAVGSGADSNAPRLGYRGEGSGPSALGGAA